MAENDNLTQGIAAVQSGELEKARAYLAKVVKEDPQSEAGWLWLGKCLTNTEQQKYCYERVLQINPQNSEAQSALDRTFLSAVAEPASPIATILEKTPMVEEQTDIESKANWRSNRLFVTLLGIVIGLCICGVPLLLLIDAGILDPLVAYLPGKGPITFPSNPFIATATGTFGEEDIPESSTLTPGMVYIKLGESRELLAQGKYAEAIMQLDQLIQSTPGLHEAYYLRATGYYRLTDQQRSLSEYQDYLQKALADIDQAIAIQSDNGDYYMLRSYLLSTLSDIQEYRVDKEYLMEYVVENSRAALNLGTTLEQYPDRVYGINLIYANHCEEGLQELQAIIDRTDPNDTSITGLYHSQSLAYICLNQVDKAIEMVDKSMSNSANMLWKQQLKARYLYQAGRSDEALQILNQLIEEHPNYTGWRYYLRALIYQERGEREKAEEDLRIGAGNTWGHSHLYSYVQGKMALEDGNETEGIRLLQEAEATMDILFAPLRIRIRAELEELGAPPLQLEPHVRFSATPMPAAIATRTATPTPESFLPPDADRATVVDFATGTGELTLLPNDNPLFHFRPSEPISIKQVISLTGQLRFSGVGPTGFEVRINYWTPRRAEMTYSAGREGDIQVSEPETRLMPNGDIFISIQNTSTKTFVLENMTLTLVVETTDGQIITYGPK